MKNNNLRKNKVLNLTVIFALFFLQSNFTYAFTTNNLPQGAKIVNGIVSIRGHHFGRDLDIRASNDAIIDWNSFNIGAKNTVTFIQPDSSSVVLNRVVGVDPSSILGILNANGRVFLVNPNGIFFGPHSQVNVNGLLASTLDISNDDFRHGRYFFQKGRSGAYIINQGNIHISNGGYVLLLSQSVDNAGFIEARLGHVLLAAGEKMTVALDDDSDISVTIDSAVNAKNIVIGSDRKRLDVGIQNSGSIIADGGTILLNAKILNGIFDNAINNTGVIQANSLRQQDGSIELVAAGGDITSSSKSVISAKGGSIDINTTGALNIQARSLTAESVSLTAADFNLGSNWDSLDIDADNILLDDTSTGRSAGIDISKSSTGGSTETLYSDDFGSFTYNDRDTNLSFESNGIIKIDVPSINAKSLSLTASGFDLGGRSPLEINADSISLDDTSTGRSAGIDISKSSTGGSTETLYSDDFGSFTYNDRDTNLSFESNGTIKIDVPSINAKSLSLTASGFDLGGRSPLEINAGSISLDNTSLSNSSSSGINISDSSTRSGDQTLTGNFGSFTYNEKDTDLAFEANKLIKITIGSITAKALSLTAPDFELGPHNGSLDINADSILLDNTSSSGIDISNNFTKNDNEMLDGNFGSFTFNDRDMDLSLEAIGDITIGADINVGRGDLTLTSVDGAIKNGEQKKLPFNSKIKQETPELTAGTISLNAKDGVGTQFSAIDTNANTLTANVSGHRASINIDNVSKNTVTLKEASSNDGAINISSDGSINANNVKSNGGDIKLTAEENVNVGIINAAGSGRLEGNVILQALHGFISAQWFYSLVTGNAVILDAGRGIEGAQERVTKIAVKILTLLRNTNENTTPFRTNANVLIANVTGHRASINIDNISSRTVTLKDVSTNDGNITINGNGSINANDVKSNGGDIKITAKDNINVGTINASGRRGEEGNVFLTAWDGFISGESFSSLITANFLFLDAKKGIRGAAQKEPVKTITKASLLPAPSEPLSVGLRTDANVIVAKVTGRHDSINIDNVSRRTVTLKDVSTNDGNIIIKANGSINANDVKSNGGDIKLTAKDNINVGIINASGWRGQEGNVFLTAWNGFISGDWFNSLVTGNLVVLDAKKGIGGRRALKTDAKVIVANVTGRRGSINIDNVSRNTVTLKSVITNNGNITVTADGSINANNVVAGGVDSNIDLTAKGRANVRVGALAAGNSITINANNILAKGAGGDVANDSLLVANTINLNARDNIGSSSPNSAIGTVSNFLNVQAKKGDVNLDLDPTTDISSVLTVVKLVAGGLANLLTGNVLLDAITTMGNLTLEALTGDITLNGTVQSTQGAVALLSDNGSINANDGSTVIANADSFFSTPNGTIGVNGSPVNVDINGNLVLNIGTRVGAGMDSGYLTGTVNAAPGNIPLFLNSSFPSPLYPPGNVYFNGIRIWPTERTFELSQAVSGLISQFIFPSTQQLSFTQVNTFDPSTSGGQSGGSGLFLYHPLMDLDSGAFDKEFQLDEGAYDFIDGDILKKGH